MAIVSSHTLNGMNGTHASGIRVRLMNITQNLEVFISHIDPSGRLEKNVDLSLAQKEDRFELIFETGEYWNSLGLSSSDNQIISEVVLRFSMPDKNARYHMPVILSPNSYSTWASQPE
ncbi:MAG: hydroxyisourate hydrolase [Paracoccaceae bacterium]|jgi:5-hydroxyisourate hydrolase|nr:hypothetical protein [Rhodobacterales bacterium]NCX58354.1 hypothetical protein [Paracoccaceae bacterium]NCX86744.1 hypothetical protein [Paracoccaceae bacterium]